MRTAICVVFFLAVELRAQDMPLSDILIEGENWEQIAEGYQFTDAACADAAGNFYFTDVGKGTSIKKIDLEGKLSAYIENTPKISGLKWGPDGRLYAATQGPKKEIVAFTKSGEMKVIMEEAEPNDLVVTRKGGIYFTQTGKQQVVYIDPAGRWSVVDKGINKPNGITLLPDQGTLVVSDYGGTNLWFFRIEKDGSLSGKEPYAIVVAPHGKASASGDGMSTDAEGRIYVATEMGIQMFDPTGRLGGVLTRPQSKFGANLAFAGKNHEYLYVVCTDKVYRRKTKARGALFY